MPRHLRLSRRRARRSAASGQRSTSAACDCALPAARDFVDVVVGVSSAAAVGQGHAAADAVERAVEEVLPGSDVVVHVEPGDGGRVLRERIVAAALTVPAVREVHNVNVLELGNETIVSLHVKVPSETLLEEVARVTRGVESAVRETASEIAAVQLHVEPLTEPIGGREIGVDAEPGLVATIRNTVRSIAFRDLASVRLFETEDGIVIYLTLVFAPDVAVAEAHSRARKIEEAIRQEASVVDVVVQIEPTVGAGTLQRIAGD